METPYSSLIERYFDNTLSDVESEEVHALLKSNEAFKTEFELFEKANQVVSLYAQQELKATIKEIDNSVPPKGILTPMRIAASLFIVGLIALLLNAQRLSNERLYAKHYVVANDYVTDLDDELTDMERALEAYNKKAYFEAITSFETILENDTENQEARFYRGQCFLQTDQINKAKSDFAEVSGSYQWEAQWYLSLTLLKLNDIETCKEILGHIIRSSDDQAFVNKSEKLLKSLNSSLRRFVFTK